MSLEESWLPFFVAWDDAVLHPGADAPVRVVDGPPGLRRVAIATDVGELLIA